MNRRWSISASRPKPDERVLLPPSAPACYTSALRSDGPLAQVVEHRAFNPLVEGSSPSRPTISPNAARIASHDLDPPSRPVRSSQTGVHPRLAERVGRHRSRTWQAPVHAGSRAEFEAFREWRDRSRPLVLDSGCGTGASTVELGHRHPGAQVLGIDRSAHRLARAPAFGPDRLCIRARLEDAWRLLAADGDRPVRP